MATDNLICECGYGDYLIPVMKMTFMVYKCIRCGREYLPDGVLLTGPYLVEE